jgi:hypothetical protein
MEKYAVRITEKANDLLKEEEVSPQTSTISDNMEKYAERITERANSILKGRKDPN